MRKSSILAFSLIELLVVLVILGVISSVGISSYGKYKLETYRKEAQTALIQAHSYVESYRIQYNTSDISNVDIGNDFNTKRYKISINPTTGSNGNYYLEASVDDSKQSKDDPACHKMVIFADGTTRDSASSNDNSCWF